VAARLIWPRADECCATHEVGQAPSHDAPELDAVHRCLRKTVENMEPTVAAIDRLDAALMSVARQSPQGIGLMVIIHSDAKPPRDETRARIKAVVPKLNNTTRAVAHVMDGEGFVAATKRSMLTLMICSTLCFRPEDFSPGAGAVAAATLGDAASADTPVAEFTAMIDELRRSHFTAPPQNTP
jgi:hypothetical protein